LNRAGRIFGAENHDLGLKYLRMGIDAAKELSDGWFWFANLIEFAELSYAAWLETGNPAYRDYIYRYADEVGQASAEFQYPDLSGRWLVVQGNLQVRAWQADNDVTHLEEALGLFTRGFALIATGQMGSSGAVALPRQFKALRELLQQLPPDIRLQWLQQFSQEWSDPPGVSELLLPKIAALR
jgi:hypothetical protein